MPVTLNFYKVYYIKTKYNHLKPTTFFFYEYTKNFTLLNRNCNYKLPKIFRKNLVKLL